MSEGKGLSSVHPEGERQEALIELSERGLSLDTFAGKIQLKWAPEASVSSLGLMPFFIEFLKTSGLFDKWVEECPLRYTSANAPRKRDVLGTVLLAVLAGHWRYAHISAIRGDGVNPGLLGMTKVASEDSVRRALAALPEEESGVWLKQHLKASYEPLLVLLCYKCKQNEIELFCGKENLRGRATRETLCGIHGGRGQSRRTR
jgi:hypothetical protein